MKTCYFSLQFLGGSLLQFLFVFISILNPFQHLGVEDELVPLVSVSELSRPEPKEGDLVRKVYLL